MRKLKKAGEYAVEETKKIMHFVIRKVVPLGLAIVIGAQISITPTNAGERDRERRQQAIEERQNENVTTEEEVIQE